jgi:hypothetical protein
MNQKSGLRHKYLGYIHEVKHSANVVRLAEYTLMSLKALRTLFRRLRMKTRTETLRIVSCHLRKSPKADPKQPKASRSDETKVIC